MINLKILSYKAHKKYISHSKQLSYNDNILFQNEFPYKNYRFVKYKAARLFAEIIDLLFISLNEIIDNHNVISHKPITHRPTFTQNTATTQNLFGYIFCKINKCTSLNTFICLNQSG